MERSLETSIVAMKRMRPARTKVTSNPANTERKPDPSEPAKVAKPTTALYTPRAEPGFRVLMLLNIIVLEEV